MANSSPRWLWLLVGFLSLALLVGSFFLPEKTRELPEIITTAPIDQPPLDSLTGFMAVGDYQIVVANCTGCHSSQLVLQNRATANGWRDMIRWMQETQGLWELGPNEDKIVQYLATHYAPEATGRRTNLAVEDWYDIQD